ncbi:hypothetical protein Tco_1317064 [Tanacetum coccineum]
MNYLTGQPRDVEGTCIKGLLIKGGLDEEVQSSRICWVHVEEDLRQMIDELDRSNEMVNKHMAEYEQAEQDLSLEEKIDLIKVLLNYQKNLAQVKKYQAQQQRLGSKTERRKF